MADIEVVETHTLAQDEAKRRVQTFEDQLDKWRLKARWNGFEAELKGTGANGSVVVSASDVRIEIKLGFLAKAAGIDAKRAKESLQKRLRAVLDGAA